MIPSSRISNLSIIILTNRADERFELALASAQFAVDILIIDNNSGNNWTKLRRKYHFRIKIYKAAVNNFSAVRNWAMSFISSQWVMFLDSDEEILPKSVSEIKNIIKKNDAGGVIVTRTDIFLGKSLKFGEAGRHKTIRLLQKDKGQFKNNVHETVAIGGTMLKSNIQLIHHPHPSIFEFIASIATYAQIASNSESKQKSTIVFKLIFYPPLKFFHNFVLKLGFLDGWRGLIYALVMSVHSLSVRSFAYEKQST